MSFKQKLLPDSCLEVKKINHKAMKYLGLAALLLLSAMCVRADYHSSFYPDAAGFKGLELDGTISFRSVFPEPSRSDYPDCTYSVIFRVNNIFENPANIEIGKDILVLLDAFKDRTLLDSGKFAAGDSLRLRLLPFSEAPMAVSSIQQAEDSGRFDLELFYAVHAKKVDKLSGRTAPPTGRWRTPKISDEPLNPAPSSSEIIARDRALNQVRLRLSEEIAKLAELTPEKLKQVNSDLEKQLSGPVDNNQRVRRVAHGSLVALKQDTRITSTKPEPVNMRGLLELHNYLKFHNVDLIVVPVPDWEEIAFNVMFPEYEGLLSAKRLGVIKALSDSGVEVIDGTDAVTSTYRESHNELFFYYPSDSHPCGITHDVLIDLLIERLQRYEFWDNPPYEKERFTIEREPFRTASFSIPGQSSHFRFQYPDYRVFLDGNYLTEFNDSTARVIIAGNSFTTSSSCRPTAPALLAAKSGHLPMYLYMNGFLPDFIATYLIKNEEGWLRNRRALVLYMQMFNLARLRPFADIRNRMQNLYSISSKMTEQLDIEAASLLVNDEPIITSIDDERSKFDTKSLVGRANTYERFTEHVSQGRSAGKVGWHLLPRNERTKIKFPIRDLQINTRRQGIITFSIISFPGISLLRIADEKGRRILQDPLSRLFYTPFFIPVSLSPGQEFIELELTATWYAEIAVIANIQLHF